MIQDVAVTPREGRVSRNVPEYGIAGFFLVTPREGRVSRNIGSRPRAVDGWGHAPRGACE